MKNLFKRFLLIMLCMILFLCELPGSSITALAAIVTDSEGNEYDTEVDAPTWPNTSSDAYKAFTFPNTGTWSSTKQVSTGVTGTVGSLKSGYHFYAVDKSQLNENIKISKWINVNNKPTCSNTFIEWDGIVANIGYNSGRCHKAVSSCWQPVCADCGEQLTYFNAYSDESFLKKVTYLVPYTHYVTKCPHEHHLVNAITSLNHICRKQSPNKFHIDYVSNASFGWVAPTTHYYTTSTSGIDYDGSKVSQDVNLPATSHLVKDGYRFLGWSTDPSAASVNISASANIWNVIGSTVPKDGQRFTLYGVWDKVPQSLQINANGGLYNGSSTYTTSGYLNDTYTIDLSKLTAPNGNIITFNGNGGTAGKSSIISKRSFAGFTKTASFRGQLVGNLYTFPATTSGTDVLTAQWVNGTVTLPNATRTNYNFTGWYTDAACTNPVGTYGDVYHVSSNVTLYAGWADLSISSTSTAVGTKSGGNGGSISLTWNQADSSNKVYKLYRSINNSNWNDLSSSLSNPVNKEIVGAFNSYGSFYAPITGLYAFNIRGGAGGSTSSASGGKGANLGLTKQINAGTLIEAKFTAGGSATGGKPGGDAAVLAIGGTNVAIAAGGGGASGSSAGGDAYASSMGSLATGTSNDSGGAGGAGSPAGTVSSGTPGGRIIAISTHPSAQETVSANAWHNYNISYTCQWFMAITTQRHDVDATCGTQGTINLKAGDILQYYISNKADTPSKIRVKHSNGTTEDILTVYADCTYVPGSNFTKGTDTNQYEDGIPWIWLEWYPSGAGNGGGYAYKNNYFDSVSATVDVTSRTASMVYSYTINNVSEATSFTKTAKDNAAPNVIPNVVCNFSSPTASFTWAQPLDNGTSYYHKVQSTCYSATASQSAGTTLTSNVVNDVITVGFWKYAYILNQTSNTDVTEATGTLTNNTSCSIDMKGKNGTWYFHIAAIDKNGNVGATKHVSITIPSTPSTNRVTFNANGGVLQGNSYVTVTPGNTTGNVATSATRTGYIFDGYTNGDNLVYDSSKNAIRDTKFWDASGKWKYNSNITVNAKWIPVSVNIVFHRNYSTSDYTTNTSTFTYDTSPVKKLYNSVGWSRENYEFLGWAKSPSATVPDYAMGANFGNSDILSVYNKGGKLDLYAVWKLKEYTVVYSPNTEKGGSGDAVQYKYQYGKSYTPLTWKASGFTKKGYELTYWTEFVEDKGLRYDAGNSDYSDKVTVTQLKDSFSTGTTTTLFAQWQPNKFTIRFHKGDSTDGLSSDYVDYTVQYDEEFIMPENFWKRIVANNESTFLGWTPSAFYYNHSPNPSGDYSNDRNVNGLYKPNEVVKNLAVNKSDVIHLYPLYDDYPVLRVHELQISMDSVLSYANTDNISTLSKTELENALLKSIVTGAQDDVDGTMIARQGVFGTGYSGYVNRDKLTLEISNINESEVYENAGKKYVATYTITVKLTDHLGQSVYATVRLHVGYNCNILIGTF